MSTALTANRAVNREQHPHLAGVLTVLSPSLVACLQGGRKQTTKVGTFFLPHAPLNTSLGIHLKSALSPGPVHTDTRITCRVESRNHSGTS